MTELETRTEAEALNLDPITGAPGSHPIGTGIGATGGAAAGMAIGSMVAGPLGSAVGGAVGALAGGLAGKGVGEAVNPTAEVAEVEAVPAGKVEVVPVAAAQLPPQTRPDSAITSQLSSLTGEPVDPVAEDLFWQRAFITEPYFDASMTYDDYAPAYGAGIAMRLGEHGERSWEEVEPAMKALWPHRKGMSRLDWEQAREPALAAWQRVDHELTQPADPYFGHA